VAHIGNLALRLVSLFAAVHALAFFCVIQNSVVVKLVLVSTRSPRAHQMISIVNPRLYPLLVRVGFLERLDYSEQLDVDL